MQGAILSDAERSQLKQYLQVDAEDYFQSALVSFFDAIRSIPLGFYSWATVKLYYCVFYALRCRLAIAGQCIFYSNGKPRYVNLVPGCAIRKLSGTTHGCVLDVFSSAFPTDFFLSQDIGSIGPLKWLLAKREEVNYRLSRFSEPRVPDYFGFASQTDIRTMLTAYKTDDIYMFDPDHAIVAFPFRLLGDVRDRLTALGISPLQVAEVEFLQMGIRDKAGMITALGPLLV